MPVEPTLRPFLLPSTGQLHRVPVLEHLSDWPIAGTGKEAVTQAITGM
jgi:hypothetical protein